MTLSAAVIAVVAWLHFIGSRPITVSATEICAHLPFGLSSRCVRWSELNRIEQMRFYDWYSSQDRSTYIFVANFGKLRFSDEIADLDPLLSEVNCNIREYKIPVFLRDYRRTANAPPVPPFNHALGKGEWIRIGRLER
jgi:hypothetical protein